MKIYNKGYFRYSSNTIREVENIKHVYKAIQQIMFQEWLSQTKKGGWELVRNLIQMFFTLSHPDYHQSWATGHRVQSVWKEHHSWS